MEDACGPVMTSAAWAKLSGVPMSMKVASAAGIDEAPGRVMPSVSAIDIMVAAVPMATGFLIDHIGFTATFFIMCAMPLPSLALLLLDLVTRRDDG